MTIKSRHSKSVLIGVLAASLSLGACATNPDGSTANVFTDLSTAFESDDPNLLPEQRALRQQQRDYSQARLTSLGVGAVGGAVAGALIGAAVDGGRGAIAGAALGVAAGGAAGYLGGSYLTRDHQNFTASRDTLQADIAAAKEDTEKMRVNVQVAERALAAQRTQINKLNADLRAGRISEQEARQKTQALADDIKAVRALAEESERRIANLSKSAASYRRAQLPTAAIDAESKQQNAKLAQLRKVEQSLVAMHDRTPANLRRAT